MKNPVSHKQKRIQTRFCILIVSLFLFLAIAIWFILSPNRSIVVNIDDWNIEMTINDTLATASIIFGDGYSLKSTNIQVNQQADSELMVQLDFNGVADISIFHGEGNFLGQRTVMFDEIFTVLPTGQNEVYTFVITPRGDTKVDNDNPNTFSVQPQRIRRFTLDDTDTNQANIRFESPSCLQMALFAHMAYFPFDFNAGELPQQHDFKPFHHEPFYGYVMTYNAWGLNSFGFNFANEMYGWHLTDVYDDENTGFRIVLYRNSNSNKFVLSIRGTYGGMIDSLSTQTGTWWYNFQSLSGYRHAHVDSLINFINEPEITNKLINAEIYITGHSLGGYLAYVAAYELSQMGLANIRRVAAFSAPTFYIETINALNSLAPEIRLRISHFYVHYDLIAGIIGIGSYTEFPDYDTFALVSQIFRSMRENRGIDVPIALQILSDGIGLVEGISPFAVPVHIRELLWIIDGTFSLEANMLIEEFSNVVWHESVNQIWHSARPIPNIPLVPSVLEVLIVDMVFDLIDRIFDTDTHFMMNFYAHLATQSIAPNN